MKKIYITLLLSIILLARMSAQNVLLETGFEGPGFDEGWTIGVSQGIDLLPQDYPPGLDPWEKWDITESTSFGYVHSGDSAAWIGGTMYEEPTHDWLMTPLISLPDNESTMLYYWLWYHSEMSYVNRFYIMIYDNETATWEQAYLLANEFNSPYHYIEEYKLNLNPWMGKDIKIAFVKNGTYQMAMDDIRILSSGTDSENNPVQNLNKIQNDLDYMMLTWDLPQNTSYDEKILSWSDDMLYTICAAGVYEEQEALHYFTSDDISEYVGWRIKQIAFIPLGTENAHSIVIWEEIDEEKTLVYEQEINNENLVFREWNYIDLDEDFYFENNKNYYIGFSSDGHSDGHWIFPADSGEPNYGRNWIHIGESEWHCFDEAVRYNLCIKTIIENHDGKTDDIDDGIKNNNLTGYKVYINNEIVKELSEPYITCYFDTEFESANDIQYCVTAVYGDVESESLCVEHVSIDDITDSSKIEIYPNPANEFVKIKTPDNNASEILTVTDISGRILITEKITGDDIYLNVANLAKGIYIIKVGEKSEKLIIKG